jgi:flagellar hook protein FlgE
MAWLWRAIPTVLRSLSEKSYSPTFASNEGLRQNGDSSYLSSAKSGAAAFGEAGTCWIWTIRAGARERSNVDLTTELVGLITAQRNFQANAKAIETSSALTSAIINIRS